LALLITAPTGSPAQSPRPDPAHHGSSPTVSPDGRQIAFVSDRSGSSDLYLMNADGSGVRQLTADGGHPGRAYWSGDGTELAFGAAAKDTTRLLRLTLARGTPIELGRFIDLRGVVPFPDRARALLSVGSWTDTQLAVSQVDGSNRRALTRDHAAWWCP